jgi:prepilin-type N-terminal cleavage/methylation domain-containing protein
MIHPDKYSRRGFTLIELSIVLVIIGLITGGILVGRDLIDAATIRAQISQIEKYQAAVNTFRVKYDYLPGDIPDPTAQQFGFKPRGGGIPAEGDGNGILEGTQAGDGDFSGVTMNQGETAVFWVDLSTAHLIDGGFSLATAVMNGATDQSYFGSDLYQWFPQAKIPNNFVYVYSGGCCGDNNWVSNNINYFGLSEVDQLVNADDSGQLVAYQLSMSIVQAYNIDKKIDDGYPQSGHVIAQYDNAALGGASCVGDICPPIWAAGGGTIGVDIGGTASASPTTCYDNGGHPGTVMAYSMGTGDGMGMNCALSFQFQ